ncbi:hypothetical protein [Colwellia sp. MEBiC06753]
MKTEQQQLVNFFLRYIEGFSYYDLSILSNCYQLPCVLSTPEKTIVLSSKAEFDNEFSVIFDMLKTNNTQGFKAANTTYQWLNKHLVCVSIDWKFVGENNQVFAEFSALYHLSFIQEQFKIFNVVSHDTALGTPFEHRLNLQIKESIEL